MEDDEDSDDSVIKLTGRLEQVFESSRLAKHAMLRQSQRKKLTAAEDNGGKKPGFLQRSSRFNRISVPSPQFDVLHESKSVSSPSS